MITLSNMFNLISTLCLLALDINQPNLLLLMCQFLACVTGPNPNASESDLFEHSLPTFLHKISIYTVAQKTVPMFGHFVMFGL